MAEKTLQGSILVVDNDPSICRALHITLQALGFYVVESSTGEEALALLRTTACDIVLLDMNMPGMGGLEACREIRRLFPNLGILMLTVRDSVDDKVDALETGADDYVTKPFHVRELTARIRALVRRVRTLGKDGDAVIRVKDVELDPLRREVYKAGRRIHLTPKEFELLHYLMAHAGLPITHGRLLSAVWGPDYGGEVEYLRTFVRQLRKKIEDDAVAPKYLLTEIQVGYRFRESDAVLRAVPAECAEAKDHDEGGRHELG